MLNNPTNVKILVDDGFAVFHVDSVAAAIIVTKKNDSRPYCRAIHFTTDAVDACVEATDTFRLVRVREIIGAGIEYPRIDVALMGESLTPLVKAAKHGYIAIKTNDDGNTCEVIAATANKQHIPEVVSTNTLRLLDGKYPDFNQLLDGYTFDETAIPALNSEYFADVCKIAQLATDEKGTAIRPLFKGGSVCDHPAMFYSENRDKRLSVEQLLMPVRI